MILSATVTVVPRRLLLGVLAVLFALSVASVFAQGGTSEIKVSTQLTSYLGLTTQQKRSVAKLNRQSSAKTETERARSLKLHQGVVASLTADQREKLKALESSTGNADLKTEARTLHLLSPKENHCGFGGATTKYSTSTCVEPGENKNSPPPSPPQ
jgi:hypothetical protein